MKNNRKIAIRDAFGDEILKLKEKNDDIIVLDADLASSLRLTDFSKKFKDSFIEVGIAEQNMMGISAGLATLGFTPFTSTFACFCKRALDQIRVTIAQPSLNVKILGAYTGLFTGKTGKTHQAVQDIAIMRTMPNMRVVVPGDWVDMVEILKAVVDYKGPVYLRIARPEVPAFLPKNYKFRWGEPYVLENGERIMIFSTGIFTSRALKTSEILKDKGIDCGVVHLPSIKPLNENAIYDLVSKAEKVITLENHNVLGGLGSRIAEILSEQMPKPILRVGIDDIYGESAPNDDLSEKYGLTVEDITEKCLNFINKK